MEADEVDWLFSEYVPPVLQQLEDSLKVIDACAFARTNSHDNAKRTASLFLTEPFPINDRENSNHSYSNRKSTHINDACAHLFDLPIDSSVEGLTGVIVLHGDKITKAVRRRPRLRSQFLL